MFPVSFVDNDIEWKNSPIKTHSDSFQRVMVHSQMSNATDSSDRKTAPLSNKTENSVMSKDEQFTFLNMAATMFDDDTPIKTKIHANSNSDQKLTSQYDLLFASPNASFEVAPFEYHEEEDDNNGDIENEDSLHFSSEINSDIPANYLADAIRQLNTLSRDGDDDLDTGRSHITFSSEQIHQNKRVEFSSNNLQRSVDSVEIQTLLDRTRFNTCGQTLSTAQQFLDATTSNELVRTNNHYAVHDSTPSSFLESEDHPSFESHRQLRIQSALQTDSLFAEHVAFLEEVHREFRLGEADEIQQQMNRLFTLAPDTLQAAVFKQVNACLL
jgi:hypothetical protein